MIRFLVVKERNNEHPKYVIQHKHTNFATRKTKLTQPSTRSEEHTSELQSHVRISYAVFCLKKKKKTQKHEDTEYQKAATRKTNGTDRE